MGNVIFVTIVKMLQKFKPVQCQPVMTTDMETSRKLIYGLRVVLTTKTMMSHLYIAECNMAILILRKNVLMWCYRENYITVRSIELCNSADGPRTVDLISERFDG